MREGEARASRCRVLAVPEGPSPNDGYFLFVFAVMDSNEPLIWQGSRRDYLHRESPLSAIVVDLSGWNPFFFIG